MQVELRERTFGELVALAFNLVVAHFGKLFAIACLLGLPALFLNLLLLPFTSPAMAPEVMSPGEGLVQALLLLLLAIVVILVYSLQQAASILILAGSFTGESPSLGDSLRVGLSKLWQIIAYSMVTGLILTLGLLCLIVPAFIFLTWYYVGAPAIVVEDLDWRTAMPRSKELSRGRRWQIIGFVLFFALVLNLVLFGAHGILVAIFKVNVFTTFLEWLLSTAAMLPATAAAVVYYFQLRVVKEALDVETLAGLVNAIEERAKATV